jgi:hypothetical protein
VTVGDWSSLTFKTNGSSVGLKPGDKVIVEGTAKIFPIPGSSPIALGPPPERGNARRASRCRQGWPRQK